MCPVPARRQLLQQLAVVHEVEGRVVAEVDPAHRRPDQLARRHERRRRPERLLQPAGEVQHLARQRRRGRRSAEGDAVVVGLRVALVLMGQARDREGAEGLVERRHRVGRPDAVTARDVREAALLGPQRLGSLERATDPAGARRRGDGDVGGVEAVVAAESIVLVGPGDAAKVLDRPAEAEAEDLTAVGVAGDEAEADGRRAAQIGLGVAARGLVGVVLDRHDRRPVALVDRTHDHALVELGQLTLGHPGERIFVAETPQVLGDAGEEVVEVAVLPARAEAEADRPNPRGVGHKAALIALIDERVLGRGVRQIEGAGGARDPRIAQQRRELGAQRVHPGPQQRLDVALLVGRLELDEPAQRRGHADLVRLRVGPARQHHPYARLLGAGNEIGGGARVAAEAEALPPEERAAGGEARLHLVDDQRQPVGAGQPTHAEQELAREVHVAALGHHRLDQHRVDLVAVAGQRPLERRQGRVAEHRLVARELEGRPLLRVPGRRQGRQGTPVKAVLEREHAPTRLSVGARRHVQAGQPQRLLVGLRAAGPDEADVRERRRGQPQQRLGVRGELGHVMHRRIGVGPQAAVEAAGMQRADHRRVAEAVGQGGDLRAGVEDRQRDVVDRDHEGPVAAPGVDHHRLLLARAEVGPVVALEQRARAGQLAAGRDADPPRLTFDERAGHRRLRPLTGLQGRQFGLQGDDGTGDTGVLRDSAHSRRA